MTEGQYRRVVQSVLGGADHDEGLAEEALELRRVLAMWIQQCHDQEIIIAALKVRIGHLEEMNASHLATIRYGEKLMRLLRAGEIS